MSRLFSSNARATGQWGFVKPMKRSFYLIVYDIVADHRRAKVARSLESLGERVQYSVFEAYLTKEEREQLAEQLSNVIETEEDGIRFYKLCSACKRGITIVGQGEVTSPPGLVIV